MKRNNFFTQMIGIGIVVLFINSAGLPSIVAKKTTQRLPTIGIAQSTESKYYAVIAACAQYQNPKYNIPKKPYEPFSDEKLSVLYDALLQSKNWNASNIIFLLNEDATRQNILDALHTIATQIGPEDYFLFSWCGHGTEVPDADGDENRSDSWDTMDEGICPHDVEKTKTEMFNIITDDELGRAFDNITCKGMTLVFDCCLSGGLVDITSKATYTNDLKQDIKQPRSSDINGDNRVIILSTLPNFSERGIYRTGFPVIAGLAYACTHPERADKNNDGCISAEESFAIAKPLTLFQASGIYVILFLFMIIYFKYDIYTYQTNIGSLLPNVIEIYKKIDTSFQSPIGPAVIFLLLEIINTQYRTWLRTGHFILDWPILHDSYSGELPFVYY